MSDKESQTIEFKLAWQDEYLKVICAFANTDGGKLILGVDNRGDFRGLKNTKKLLEDLPNKINNKLGIIPSISIDTRGKKEIIRIKILPSSVPLSYDGKYYIRSGSTIQELKGSELSRFLLKKMGKTWDSIPCRGSFSDIKTSTIEDFKNLSRNRIPSISKLDSLDKIFCNLELTTDNGDLTNAAILLFGENPQRFFISAKTRVGRFKSSIDIIDTVIISGNLFQQVEESVEAIKKHLNVRFEIKDIQRKDIWDYPIEAIREGVINALIHKDYLSPAEIQIKIYDDKIWIWNPGKLPPELSVDDLKKEHSSYPKNPLIANAFYLTGLIERWGSGTKRIVDLCKEQGIPEPEYREEQGGFSLWFYKDIYTEENLKKMGLNERQIKAVMYVKERGRITNREYRGMFHITDRTALNDLTSLCKKGILVKIGKTGRGTEYKLVEINPKNTNETRNKHER